MRAREHVGWVRGLLGGMTRDLVKQGTVETAASTPTGVGRIDRSGARRMFAAGAEVAGEAREERSPAQANWLINARCSGAVAAYAAGIAVLMLVSSRGPEHAGAADGCLGPAPGVRGDEQENHMVMQTISVGVVVSAIASGANAGKAVQWKVSDGGNGHWYQQVGADIPGQMICWSTARDLCRAAGGELVSINSQQEERFLIASCSLRGWIGYQPTGYWSSGEPVAYTHWGPGQPSGDGPYAAAGGCLDYGWDGGWNDIGGSGGCWNGLASYTIEWSADCNNDGIVDYGQILDGTFTDANSNGVPDCCEQGVPCSSCHLYDLNLNGSVDGADLGVLLAFWGPVSPAFPRADINGDGRVDGSDLGLLLSNWGPCPQ